MDFRAILAAVKDAFGSDVDFAQLVKIYAESGGGKTPEKKYSPGVCIGAHKDKDQRQTGPEAYFNITCGAPEPHHAYVHASVHAADHAHSKKVENHCHALALYFLFYNWMRPHASLEGKTPAMVAKLAKAPMTMADLAG